LFWICLTSSYEKIGREILGWNHLLMRSSRYAFEVESGRLNREPVEDVIYVFSFRNLENVVRRLFLNHSGHLGLKVVKKFANRWAYKDIKSIHDSIRLTSGLYDECAQAD
jgi:hypothetical protein